ncbi:MAG: ferredoxin [Acidimicrobiia bacterium]|nr:ferredoxin [Acidimicrobiia bacterium]
MAIDIAINREVCMGSGNCSFWAPATFDLDDDGVAIVIDATGDPEDKVILAAQGCPTQAISVSLDGEKIV